VFAGSGRLPRGSEIVPSACENATRIFRAMRAGDESAPARLLPIVYDELRALAGHYFQRQPSDHTLQPTALVHEAFLRLVSHDEPQWADRAHFLAIAAQAMRQILIDHARRRNAAKRGGGGENWKRITLDEALAVMESDSVDVIMLEDALNRLTDRSPRQAKIVELRIFGGLTADESAQVLGVGRTTVNGDWTIAKAWLKRELAGHAAP
jgi:RNA polymerase sigma factor (TIGR02999 family)